MNKFFAFIIVLSFGLIFLAFNIQFDQNNSVIVSEKQSEPDAVSNYYFWQNFATYTPIPTGTVIATGFQDDSTYGNIPIGFPFTYNNVSYSVVGISDNGWIQPGAISPPSHYVYPMICSSYVTPVICAFNADLLGNIADTIRYLTTGTYPNRVFTIEWCHWGFHPYANNEMNFELKLCEYGYQIQFIYQPITPTTSANIQVGLLGQSASDYFTKTSPSCWACIVTGTACSYFSYSQYCSPGNGQSFTFSPNPMGIIPKTHEPKEFKLYNNFPNPFNPSTAIRFDVPKSSDVKIIVYNMLGEKITTLVDGYYHEGEYSVTWDASNYPSGVYFYRITSGNFTDVKKMILVK